MSIKGVLLDFDGTMADTVADIAASVNFAIHHYYGPGYGIDLDQCRRTVGRGLRNELKSSLDYCGLKYDDALLDEGLVLLEDYYARHPIDHTRPYEGISEALKICNERGFKLGVFSNKADTLLKMVVQSLFSEIKFDYICGMQPSIPRKPSPEGLYIFADRFGFGKEDYLYVGDSEVDWQTGQNAGVRTRIVTWGFRTTDQLTGSGVIQDALINTMDELKAEFRR